MKLELTDGYTSFEKEIPWSKRVTFGDLRELYIKAVASMKEDWEWEYYRKEWSFALDTKEITYDFERGWTFRGMSLDYPFGWRHEQKGSWLRPQSQMFRQYGRLFEVYYFHDCTAASITVMEE